MNKNKKQLLLQIGDRLESLRQQLKLSKDDMAAHCGLTANGYAKNERGNTLPGVDTLSRLSKNFDISMDWLLFDRGPIHYAHKDAVTQPSGPVSPGMAAENAAEEGRLPGSVSTGQEPPAYPPDLVPVGADIQKLLAHMALDPQFRYEILAQFFKYLKDHPQPLPQV